MVALESAKQIACFAVIVGFLSITIVVLGLRLVARSSTGAIGWDDRLMICAQMFFVGSAVAGLCGCLDGIGAYDEFLTFQDMVSAQHAYFVYVPLYACTLMFMKTSICFTLLRIAQQKAILYTIYALIVVCVLDGIIAVIAVLNLCHPIAGAWDPTKGTCVSGDVVIKVGLFISVTAIMTDFACAIMPSIMLWNLQMKRSLKWSVVAVLSLGFFASTATIVRLHYLNNYDLTINYVWSLGDLTIWSVVECGVGICAASVPTLKPLVRRWVSTSLSTSDYTNKRKSPRSRLGYSSRLKNEDLELNMMGQDRKEFTTNITSRKDDQDHESEKDILGVDGIIISSEFELHDEPGEARSSHAIV